MHLRRLCILLPLDGIFFICLLRSLVLIYNLRQKFLIEFLCGKSGKSSTVIISPFRSLNICFTKIRYPNVGCNNAYKCYIPFITLK